MPNSTLAGTLALGRCCSRQHPRAAPAGYTRGGKAATIVDTNAVSSALAFPVESSSVINGTSGDDVIAARRG